MEMRAQASNLSEELGQVEYVFSDKTGTLTCNIMTFKKFTVGTEMYGTYDDPNGFHDPALNIALENLKSSTESKLSNMIIFMAVCHTIIIDQRTGEYNASSPDELALVEAAKKFGFEFIGKDASNIITVHDKINDINH